MLLNQFFRKSLVSLALVMLMLAGACTPVGKIGSGPAMMGGSSSMPMMANTSSDGIQRGGDLSLGTPDVSFTLKGGLIEGGKMAFVGVGGDLDGKINPDLHVKPGDIVEIKLINGDDSIHDLTINELGVATDLVSSQNKEAVVKFKAGEDASYSYFCSIPGHRQAGMEGKLIVGNGAAAATSTVSIVRSPDDLPGPITRSTPQTVRVDLEAQELQARLADGVSYTFWTFNGKVPGPFIRVRVGDTVEVHLKNAPDSTMSHSVDFHAVIGPGGGSVATQTAPGKETSFTFKAMNPGIFVYHCATPMVSEHISNGMYGMILVEPEGGLPEVDREFYVMQGEVYTTQKMGEQGVDTPSIDKLLDEQPEYFVFNGAVGGLTNEHPLQAEVGQTVRIFFGVGGPNFTSSFHVIGELFDKVYNLGSLTSEPLTHVQTTIVPPGGATIVDINLKVPGRYNLVDHALARVERGLLGFLIVSGPENKDIFNAP